MAQSFNKVILIGNLGADPEIKRFDGGGAIANFSIATSERYKNRNGEMVDETDWHNVVVRGKTVDVVEKYLEKGDKVLIEGKIKNRSYEVDGVKRYITEIIAFNMTMLGSNNNRANSNSGAGNESTPFTDTSEFDSNDDDLPF